MDVTEKMAALFGVDVRTISYHIGQIYETGELDKTATIRKIGIVQTKESVMLSVLLCSTILMLSLLLVIVVPSYLI